MYGKFRFVSLPLVSIMLDERNPRIVTQKPLKTQEEIVDYLFKHEDLAAFIKKIVLEGRNKGAERPYVVSNGGAYTVIEGNTRIASYKLICGLLKPPAEFSDSVPTIVPAFAKELKEIECSVAPDRDALLPIMASAHFGRGDKSKWGYLGSRKAVYDEWKKGKSIAQLARAFSQTKGEINDYIIEYLLFLEALKFSWSEIDRAKLEDPGVQFNPPVRFLETSGHKNKLGIKYDKSAMKIIFDGSAARQRFRHLIVKLVVAPGPGLGATASYDQVFKDFKSSKQSSETMQASNGEKSDSSGEKSTSASGEGSSGSGGKEKSGAKPGALFGYSVTRNSALIKQLMSEAGKINCKTYPSASTFLLRNIIEAILKDIIDAQKANSGGSSLSLEGALNICKGNGIKMPAEDKKILKEFQNNHLDYLNLGAHGNLVPNFERVKSARDCVDQFVKRNV